jgi:hypothetical protein
MSYSSCYLFPLWGGFGTGKCVVVITPFLSPLHPLADLLFRLILQARIPPRCGTVGTLVLCWPRVERYALSAPSPSVSSRHSHKTTVWRGSLRAPL